MHCRYQVGDDESMTSLADIVGQVDGYDSDAVIFVEAPWGGDARATVVAADDAEAGLMAEQQGMNYFLEVHLAREMLEVWSAWRDNRRPSLADAVAASIYYAQRDAFIPMDHQAD